MSNLVWFGLDGTGVVACSRARGRGVCLVPMKWVGGNDGMGFFLDRSLYVWGRGGCVRGLVDEDVGMVDVRGIWKFEDYWGREGGGKEVERRSKERRADRAKTKRKKTGDEKKGCLTHINRLDTLYKTFFRSAILLERNLLEGG